MNTPEKTRIFVKSALMELMPAYLDRRHMDVQALQSSLQAGDFGKIQSVGHKLRGNASTYGFHALSELGAQLEAAAQQHDTSEISKLIGQFDQYLISIEICPS